MANPDAGKPAMSTLQTDTTLPEQPDLVVETPTSPSSSLALSRFEFELGKGNEGTKILMVEWDTTTAPQSPTARTKGQTNAPVEKGDKADTESGVSGGTKESATGDWEVSWEGKAKTVGVRDRDSEAFLWRVYFFLPPGAQIPSLVSIKHQTATTGASPGVLRTKPLPAIFPPALGGVAREAGRRGVLHTLWARKRLAELQAEIGDEMKANAESVGLEMAMQERQWLVDHFGLAPAEGLPRPTKLHIPAGAPAGPASPRSPVGGKLGEKLRGLRLATSPIDLAAASAVATQSAFNTANKGPTLSMSTSTQLPSSSGGIGSLDAVLGSGIPGPTGQGPVEEDLFALPMSPRSPEMTKSPFSLLK